jgi:hypothetical protein
MQSFSHDNLNDFHISCKEKKKKFYKERSGIITIREIGGASPVTNV